MPFYFGKTHHNARLAQYCFQEFESCHYCSAMTLTRIDQALQVSARAHLGTYRDKELRLPYVMHPIAVADLLYTTGNVHDEDLLCVALLHDILEETKVTSKEIESQFGGQICQLVLELTRRQPKRAQMQALSKLELKELRAQMLLEDIKVMSRNAMAIKLADRLDNFRHASQLRSPKKFSTYCIHTQKILDTIPRSANENLWSALSIELTTSYASIQARMKRVGEETESGVV